MDVKDIMGLSRAPSAAAERVEKPKEKKPVKPKGMSREAFALLSGLHPLQPSQLTGDLRKQSTVKSLRDKAKRSNRGRVTFQWRPFTNPARKDGLELSHWVKCCKDAQDNIVPVDDAEYPFAKYNKKERVFRYNDEEWEHLITQDSNWSREETDYLLDLVERLDLRWLVITDRYDFKEGVSRSMEELKERYYTVAHDLLVKRAGGEETVANHPLIRHPFNQQHERERKKGLELLFERTKEQEVAEDAILAEATTIEAARRAEEAATRRASAAEASAATPGPQGSTEPAAVQGPAPISTFSNDAEPGVPPVFDEHGAPAVPPKRVVVRGAFCKELAESVASKLQPVKIQKALEGSMGELKITEFPRAMTRATCGAYLSLQSEVLALLELKRQLATRQAMVAGSKRPAPKMESPEDVPRTDKRQRVAKKFADE